MSRFIRWVDDTGYGPDGARLYVLDREANYGEPVYWTPLRIVNGYLREISTMYYPQGWVTKSEAKKICERHYIATHSKGEE